MNKKYRCLFGFLTFISGFGFTYAGFNIPVIPLCFFGFFLCQVSLIIIFIAVTDRGVLP
jgi:hypothetical protein